MSQINNLCLAGANNLLAIRTFRRYYRGYRVKKNLFHQTYGVKFTRYIHLIDGRMIITLYVSQIIIFHQLDTKIIIQP